MENGKKALLNKINFCKLLRSSKVIDLEKPIVHQCSIHDNMSFAHNMYYDIAKNKILILMKVNQFERI